MPLPPDRYLEDVRHELQRLRRLAEEAVAQVSAEDYFRTLGPEENSLAVLVKHMAGNMRSRWTDFLTADGEKPDRDRDAEFELGDGDTRAALNRGWAEGWSLLFDALAPLEAADLERTVTIRGEPHSVLQAIQRQLSHYAYHVGQIVQLCRHFAGDSWRSLSVPKGESEAFNRTPDAYLTT